MMIFPSKSKYTTSLTPDLPLVYLHLDIGLGSLTVAPGALLSVSYRDLVAPISAKGVDSSFERLANSTPFELELCVPFASSRSFAADQVAAFDPRLWIKPLLLSRTPDISCLGGIFAGCGPDISL